MLARWPVAPAACPRPRAPPLQGRQGQGRSARAVRGLPEGPGGRLGCGQIPDEYGPSYRKVSARPSPREPQRLGGLLSVPSGGGGKARSRPTTRRASTSTSTAGTPTSSVGRRSCTHQRPAPTTPKRSSTTRPATPIACPPTPPDARWSDTPRPPDARLHGRPRINRRDFATLDDGRPGTHFVSLQRSIQDFNATHAVMNVAHARAHHPGIGTRHHNGINAFIKVTSRATFAVPQARSAPTHIAARGPIHEPPPRSTTREADARTRSASRMPPVAALTCLAKTVRESPPGASTARAA
jgi:hypothetical protein